MHYFVFETVQRRILFGEKKETSKDYMHQSLCDREEGVNVDPFTYCMFILHLK